MVSQEHQWLVLWALREMSRDGFIVAACDGRVPHGGPWNVVRGSWPLGDLRPDAWAVTDDQRIALAEAKTADHIDSSHTRSQLRLFGKFVRVTSLTRRLYISVPRSAAHQLDRILASLALAGMPQITRLHIPDCLVRSTHP